MSNPDFLRHLPLVKAPDSIWASLETKLLENPMRKAVYWRWALAAGVVLAVAGNSYWAIAHFHEERWEVTRASGVSRIGAGDVVETGSGSGATVKVGKIGSVEVAPNTKLRVVTAKPGEHRLALLGGEIQARISAPPRLFFVETPSGTAVDLGCEYTLTTDENGSGLLRVSKGWVSFRWKTLESLVPAGARCLLRPDVGPSIPYFDDAPESLKQAVESLGFVKSANDPLDVILAEARVRDTLTLWHLLSRVDPSDRVRVFDRIAALTPPPSGVTRNLVLKLDPRTLELWKDELAWTW